MLASSNNPGHLPKAESETVGSKPAGRAAGTPRDSTAGRRTGRGCAAGLQRVHPGSGRAQTPQSPQLEAGSTNTVGEHLQILHSHATTCQSGHRPPLFHLPVKAVKVDLHWSLKPTQEWSWGAHSSSQWHFPTDKAVCGRPTTVHLPQLAGKGVVGKVWESDELRKTGQRQKSQRRCRSSPNQSAGTP